MQALEDLDYLAALDDDGDLSDLGVILSEFPLPPELAKALLASCEFECVDEMLTLAAMLTGITRLSLWLFQLLKSFPLVFLRSKRLALSPVLQSRPAPPTPTPTVPTELGLTSYPSCASLAFSFCWFLPFNMLKSYY